MARQHESRVATANINPRLLTDAIKNYILRTNF